MEDDTGKGIRKIDATRWGTARRRGENFVDFEPHLRPPNHAFLPFYFLLCLLTRDFIVER
jgi:hypothetical protein